MKYSEFQRFLEYPQINGDYHLAFVINQDLNDQDFLNFIDGKIEGMDLCLHKNYSGRTYVITNSGVIFDKDFTDYEIVDDVPSTTHQLTGEYPTILIQTNSSSEENE